MKPGKKHERLRFYPILKNEINIEDLKMKMKTLAAAVVLAATTSVANAAIVTGFDTDGELFLSVFDPSGEISYHMDLGITVSQFNADDSSFRSFDLASDANFAGFLGQTDLTYSIAGANTIPYTTIAELQTYGIMTTSSQTAMQVDDRFLSQGSIDQMMGRVTTQAALLNVRTGGPYSGTNGGENGSAVALIGQQGYYDVAGWGDVNGTPGFYAAANVGTAVSFYQVNVSDVDFISAVETQMGDWLLTTDGTLTYGTAPVSAVPVPAAVWLFGSGLIGLASIARRKKA